MMKWAFLGFCILDASAWLLPDDSVSPTQGLSLFGLSCMLLSAILLAPLGKGSPRGDGNWSRWRVCVVGLLAIGLPAVLTAVAQQHLGSSTILAVWSFLPVVVAAEGFIKASDGQSTAGESHLVWALCGMAGELLLLPFTLPSAAEGRVSLTLLVLGVISAGIAAPRAFTMLRGESSAARLAFVALGGGGFAVLASGLAAKVGGFPLVPSGGWPGALSCLRVVLDVALLLFFLRSIRPLTYATRVFFAPALAAIEGAVLFRVGLNARMSTGVVLILVGAGMLWRTDRPEVTSSMSLRV